MGISCADLAKHLEISQLEVGYAANRGEKIAKEHDYHLSYLAGYAIEDDLPADLAEQHDHYLYGISKK